MKKHRTVRDFMIYFQERIGEGKMDFHNLTDAQREFWVKLVKIGARNIKTQPPETVPDINETVILSPEEWAELDAEFLSTLYPSTIH